MKINDNDTSYLESVPEQQSLFEKFDPLDADRRKFLMSDHPLMQGEGGYILPTPPAQYALTQLVAGITSGLPGMAWVAYPRFGKTSAIKFLKKQLSIIFPETPVVIFIAKAHLKPDEGRFYKEMLLASNLSVPPGHDSVDRMSRLCKGWWTWVLTSHAKRIILIIDEAQKLLVAEYSWLIDLCNMLGQKQVSVTVALFGQPELLNLRDIFLQVGRGDIIGRFMVTVQNFDGIRNSEELETVLRCLDDPVISEYPAGSACACTQFFVPKAYAYGWRLAMHSASLWAAFEHSAASTGEKALSHGISVGMTWVKIAVQNVLLKLMAKDTAHLIIQDALWLDAVSRSGFAESLGVLSSVGRAANAKPTA